MCYKENIENVLGADFTQLIVVCACLFKVLIINSLLLSCVLSLLLLSFLTFE